MNLVPTLNRKEVIFIKNPNGYGSVFKLSGNRRKPYCARKTETFDERGFPVYKVIGYFATRQEALIALGEYNKNPYDIDLSKITTKELFERWSARDFPKMAKSSANSHKSAFKHCAPLHDIAYKKIKAYQMQEIIDNCGFGYSTQGAIKNLFGHLDVFALELDVIAKKNSDLIHAAPIVPSNKRPFTEEEIELVWEHRDEPMVDTVLILIYTGFRINELLNIETEKVNISERLIQGGMKTKAGKDRIVPIHPLIFDMVKKRVEEGNERLIPLNQSQYYSFWNAFMESIGLQHTPHECRHTFRSRLDSAGANKVCINLMMGHVSKEIGERVYTHKTLEELKNALALVTR